MFKTALKLGLAVALALTLGMNSASADQTYTLSVPNSGVSSTGGPAPYGTVDVHLINPTEAQITFNAGTSGGFTYLFIDGGSAAVNVNATSFTEAFVSATGPATGGFQSPSFVGFSSGQEDGFGSVNLQVDMFDGTDHPSNQIVFDVTNTGGTWASAANVLTADSNGFLAGAHIVVFSGTPVNGAQLGTGFVANGGTTPAVPAPPSAVLLGIGGLCLAGFVIRSRRRLALSA